LRIDVSHFNSGLATRDDTALGHLIPSDNPFVGTAAGINQLIYVLGLRNPYTAAVQPGTGRLFINDVGEVTWEEINQAVAGGNYGWSGGATDGFGQHPPGPGTYHDPVLAYKHSGGLAGNGGVVAKISYQAPRITTQPADQNVDQGQPATFTVAATGPSLGYQWQHLVGNSWNNVGTNSSTLTLNNVTTSDAGGYRVIV